MSIPSHLFIRLIEQEIQVQWFWTTLSLIAAIVLCLDLVIRRLQYKNRTHDKKEQAFLKLISFTKGLLSGILFIVGLGVFWIMSLLMFAMGGQPQMGILVAGVVTVLAIFFKFKNRS